MANSAIDGIVVNSPQDNIMSTGYSTSSIETALAQVSLVKMAAGNKTVISHIVGDQVAVIDRFLDAGATMLILKLSTPNLEELVSNYPVIIEIDSLDINYLQALKKLERKGAVGGMVKGILVDTVLELVATLGIPVIATSSDINADGTCLSFYDVSGLSGDYCPPTTKPYLNGYDLSVQAVNSYVQDTALADCAA